MRRDIDFSIALPPGAPAGDFDAAFDAQMARLNESLGLREVSRSVDANGVVCVKLEQVPGER